MEYVTLSGGQVEENQEITTKELACVVDVPEIEVQPGREINAPLDEKKFHWKCFILNLGFWACFITFLGLYFTQRLSKPLGFSFGYSVLFFMSFFWSSSMTEAYLSNTAEYIKNLISHESAGDLVNKFRASPPTVWMQAVSYHYETRSRSVVKTSTDADGDSSTTYTTETYDVRVDTHTEKIDFSYDHWKEMSKDLYGLGLNADHSFTGFTICKLQLSISLVFADDFTKSVYESECRKLKDRNINRDTHMEFSECFTVEKFQNRVLALLNINQVPWALSYSWFLFASFIGLSFIYRLWLDSICEKRSFEFVKEISQETAR